MKKIAILLLMILLVSCAGPTLDKSVEASQSPAPIETKVPLIQKVFDYPFQEQFTWKGTPYQLEGTKKILSLAAQKEMIFEKNNIYLAPGEDYEITFSIASSSHYHGKILFKNEEDILLSEELSAASKDYHFRFHNEKETWLATVHFLWNSERDCSLTLENFQITSLNNPKKAVRVNQLGYPLVAKKFFSLAFDGGDSYVMVDASNQQVVYRGKLGNGREDKQNGEYNFIGDFSAFQQEGRYYIRTETGLESYPFELKKQPYQNVYQDVLRFFTLQRSGFTLTKEFSPELAREASHMQRAIPFGYEGIEKDVHGGWYDAGDYGRYLQTGIKALIPMLIAYDWHQDKNDHYLIPESGNQLPDLLDEAKWQLEWLLRMQREDGRVYHKLTTKRFAGNISPEEDKEELYLLPPWELTDTAFAGTMAFASLLYEEFDPAFASRMKEVALSWKEKIFNHRSPGNYENPEGFATGQYNDDSDKDEYFFALMSFFTLTKEEVYLEKALELWQSGVQGKHSSDLSEYGEYLVLREVDEQHDLYQKVAAALISRAERTTEVLKNRNYPYPLGEYVWGSNQLVAEEIFHLALASKASKQNYYFDYGQLLLNYLLGQNSMNISYVVGHGSAFPRNVHSRMAYARKTLLPGALVGGVNQFLSEDTNHFFSEETPIGKRYRDDYASYNTNEVAIAYNGAMLLALSFYR